MGEEEKEGKKPEQTREETGTTGRSLKVQGVPPSGLERPARRGAAEAERTV
jgi:hypothetical protein